MKILVVGAGAVGQVYAYYLMKGGADVSFYVREKYKTELEAGLKLFPMNEGANPAAIQWKNFGIITNNEELKKKQFDVIVLTLPSDALYTQWLPDFAEAVHPETHIVTLQPGLKDKEHLARFFKQEKIITGVITLIAYATPMGNGGPKEKGMAVWFPPLAKAPFDGEKVITQKLVDTFKAGGFPAAQKSVSKNPGAIAFAAAFLGTFVFTLEKHNWKLMSFTEAKNANTLTLALEESFNVIAAKYKMKVPFFVKFLGKSFYTFLIKTALCLMPFDLETYLEVHFTKVGVQMKLNMQEILDEAEALKIEIPTLKRMWNLGLTLDNNQGRHHQPVHP